MFGTRTLTRHAQLVNDMAGTVGADLPRALAEGRITGEGLREAVIRCTGCTEAEACGHWLDAHQGKAETAPGYCRNAALFERLKTGGER